MTLDQFHAKVIALIPGATIGEDNDGQLIVYTNLTTESVDNGATTVTMIADMGD